MTFFIEQKVSSDILAFDRGYSDGLKGECYDDDLPPEFKDMYSAGYETAREEMFFLANNMLANNFMKKVD